LIVFGTAFRSCARSLQNKEMLTFLGVPLSLIALIKIKRALLKCHTIEDLVDLSYSFQIMRYLTIRPSQIKEEITCLLKLLAKLQPMIVCEVGTAGGGNAILVLKGFKIQCDNN